MVSTPASTRAVLEHNSLLSWRLVSIYLALFPTLLAFFSFNACEPELLFKDMQQQSLDLPVMLLKCFFFIAELLAAKQIVHRKCI